MIKSVNKLKRKDDNMGKAKGKSRLPESTALMLLIETALRFTAGYLLLARLDGYVATMVGLYFLVTALVLVVIQFLENNK